MLPSDIWYTHIAPLLDTKSLIRLGQCSSDLQSITKDSLTFETVFRYCINRDISIANKYCNYIASVRYRSSSIDFVYRPNIKINSVRFQQEFTTLSFAVENIIKHYTNDELIRPIWIMAEYIDLKHPSYPDPFSPTEVINLHCGPLCFC